MLSVGRRSAVPPFTGPWFTALACLGAAVVLSVCYQADWIPGIGWGYAFLAAAVMVGIRTVRGSQYSLLCRYILALYAIPFVECTAYLLYDIEYFQTTNFVWGLTGNPYNRNLLTVEHMMLVGAIGAFALVAGMLAGCATASGQPARAESGKRLRMPSAFALAGLAVLFTWVSAPQVTIFTARYTESSSIGAGLHLATAYLLSYVFAVALFIDATRERRQPARTIKLALVTVTLGVIIVWFQFLRGDRESVALAAAVGALFVIQGQSAMARTLAKKRLALMAAVGVGVYLSAQLVGVIRSEAVGRNVEEAFAASRPNVNLVHGTWSAVLLTPLSVVGDFERGLMQPAWGQTYVDYALSLPPGVVAQALGYVRPIDGTRGPAWQMRYGIGGTHLLVVPFMNFLTPGVVIILFLFGLMVGVVDAHAGRGRIKDLLLYGTFFVLGPFWVWYGDLSLVRGIMSFVIVWTVYRLLPKEGVAEARSTSLIFQPADGRQTISL